jgi:uncharacterized protein (TIGR00369 family)
MATRQPPPGFELLRSSPFVTRLGSIYLKHSEDNQPVFGAIVESGHANTMGTGHGGFLSALVDVATGRGARLITGEPGAIRTVSMHIDFVAAAELGSWIEAAVTVDHSGGRTIFASCRITDDAALLARANAVLVKA